MEEVETGSRNFRKQNQALGQDGTWKNRESAPEEFQKVARYVVRFHGK